tara:strand:- start:1760 stop:4729 length:2970 start_codon:yes stop_codon:yes gene_type:complete
MKYSITSNISPEKYALIGTKPTINCDLAENLIHYSTTHPNQEINICLLCAPIEGYGDLLGGIKIANYLSEYYKGNNIFINFCVTDSRAADQKIVMENVKPLSASHYNVNNLNFNYDNTSRIKIYFGYHNGITANFDYVSLNADICIVCPGTNIYNFNFKFNVGYNGINDVPMYVLSEFNTSDTEGQNAAAMLTDVTINLGLISNTECDQALPGEHRCPIGVIFPENPDSYSWPEWIPEGQLYVLTYLYFDLKSAQNTTDEFDQTINDFILSHDEASCKSKNVKSFDCENISAHSHYYTDIYRKFFLSLMVHFNLFLDTITDYSYNNQLRNKIVIYMKDQQFFQLFLDNLNINSEFEACNDVLRKMSDPLAVFTFNFMPSLSNNSILKALRHSLPIIFASGDQTLAEFLGLNKHDILYIYYMAFEWKRGVLNALLQENIDPEWRENFSKKNPFGRAQIKKNYFMSKASNHFGVGGLQQLENLILKRFIPSSQFICKNQIMDTIGNRIDNSRFLYKVTPVFRNVNFRRLRSINFNMQDNILQSYFIHGSIKINPNEGYATNTFLTSWVQNTDYDLFIKYFPTNTLSNGDSTCKNFNVVDTENESSPIGEILTSTYPRNIRDNYTVVTMNFTYNYATIPLAINSLIINNLLNTLKDNYSVPEDEFLVKTIAHIPDYHQCANGVDGLHKRADIDDNNEGVFMIQSFVNYKVNFNTAFRCSCINMPNMQMFLLKLVYSVRKLQVDKNYNIVHNDLWSDNIFITKTGEGRESYMSFNTLGIYKNNYTGYYGKLNYISDFGIIINDFDNASYNISDTTGNSGNGNNIHINTLRFISEDGLEAGKCPVFLSYFDIGYILGDLLMMVGYYFRINGNRSQKFFAKNSEECKSLNNFPNRRLIEDETDKLMMEIIYITILFWEPSNTNLQTHVRNIDPSNIPDIKKVLTDIKNTYYQPNDKIYPLSFGVPKLNNIDTEFRFESICKYLIDELEKHNMVWE